MYVHQSQEVSISKHLQVATDGARAAAMSSPPLPFLTPPKLSSRASDTTSRSSYLLKRVELAEPGVKQHPGIVLVLHIARLKRSMRNRNILEHRSRRPKSQRGIIRILVTFFDSGLPVFVLLPLLFAAEAAAAAAVFAVDPGAEDGGSGGVAVAFARRLWSSPALQSDAAE